MDKLQIGTTAQLVYANAQRLNFARLVGECHETLAQQHGKSLTFQWGCEDIAFFDLPSMRIALGWSDKPGRGYSCCITISVGQLPTISTRLEVVRYAKSCSRMVEWLHRRHPALAIRWHQSEEPLSDKLMERLIEELPPLMELFPFQEPNWVADAMARQSPSRAVALRQSDKQNEPSRKPSQTHAPHHHEGLVEPAASPEVDLSQMRGQMRTDLKVLNFKSQSASSKRQSRARERAIASFRAKGNLAAVPKANSAFTRSGVRKRELTQVHDALYRQNSMDASAVLSTPMRLAVHALNATLIVVWAPLGAAVMTYSLLKGEDLTLSARLMVLTGLIATAIESPFGQQMAAVAGMWS